MYSFLQSWFPFIHFFPHFSNELFHLKFEAIEVTFSIRSFFHRIFICEFWSKPIKWMNRESRFVIFQLILYSSIKKNASLNEKWIIRFYFPAENVWMICEELVCSIFDWFGLQNECGNNALHLIFAIALYATRQVKSFSSLKFLWNCNLVFLPFFSQFTSEMSHCVKNQSRKSGFSLKRRSHLLSGNY